MDTCNSSCYFVQYLYSFWFRNTIAHVSMAPAGTVQIFIKISGIIVHDLDKW